MAATSLNLGRSFLVLVLGLYHCTLSTTMATEVSQMTTSSVNETTSTTKSATLATSEVSTEDTTDFAFRQEIVDEQNRYRGRHWNTPLLFEHAELVERAQARCLHYAKLSKVYSSDILAVGLTHSENIWFGWSPVKPTLEEPIFQPADIIASWYAEHLYYAYDIPTWRARTTHFTLLIWRSSLQVGCGRCVAQKTDELAAKTIVLCLYRPTGNLLGFFKSNVMPAI